MTLSNEVRPSAHGDDSTDRPPEAEKKPWHEMSGRSVIGLQAAFVATLLGSWEFCARVLGTRFWTSSPTEVVKQMASWAESGLLWEGLRVTLMETALGFVIGAVLGSFVGFSLGRLRLLGRVFEPFILSLYTLPKVALAPLFVLWFGIGPTTKVMFSGLLVFFMVFFTTFQGMRQVDEELVSIARVMGGSRYQTVRKIVLPHAAIWMFAGFRIGLPYALIGAVVGEFIAATAGLGFMIRASSSIFNTAGVFAGLLVLMAIAILLLGILRAIESRVLRWQQGNKLDMQLQV